VGDGFLFDGVDVACNDFSIDEKLEFAGCVLAYSAEADFSVWDVAVPGTGGAADPGVC